MHVKTLLTVLSTPIYKLWPRKLINKIAITNIVVLFVTIAGLSWYALTEKMSYQVNSATEKYKDYAAQIAKVSKPYIESGRVDELEEILSSFMMLETNYDIYIKDVAFNTLVALRNSMKNRVVSFKETARHIAPVDSGQYLQVDDGKLEIWYQIDEQNPVGWIYIRQVMRPIDGLTKNFIKTTITALILSVAVCLLMLQRILREPMQSLRRAAEFSEWLDMAQGNHLKLKTSSKEVEQLVHTLNTTSEKMFQKGLAEKRNHMLIDTIRDIQTQYIQNTKASELNDRILNRVVQLSESECGFFGEVKKSKRGKLFIKMRTFTRLGQNVSMQNFLERYTPPNMEFRNSHNLFGAVLQTGKPVIANDPQRDPRSGGLPPGHPALHAFMALPVFHDDDLVAVIGLANKRGGYIQSLVEYLQPLLSTIGHIVVANQHNKRRKLTSKQLEQNEVLFRRILATVSDSIITINMGGFIETVNPATEKMFGYLGEEMLNQHVNRIIPGFFVADFARRYVSSREVHYHNSEGLRKDGNSFPIELTVSEFAIGDEKLFTVTIIDISHLQHESNILGQTEQTLVEMQRMIHAGTWELNMATMEFKASDEVYYIFGLREPDNKADFAALMQRISEEDRQIVNLALDNCAENREAFVVDIRVSRSDGTLHFAQIQGSPQQIAGSSACKIVGIVQDVTDTRQMMKLKDEFIATVSEEIRSPLASIRGSIGLLSGEVAKYITEKEKFLLDTAYQNTDRLLMLINDILDVENIATGKTEFSMEFLECSKLMDAAMHASRGVASDYHVNFILDIKNKDIVLIADKQRLLQLMNILLSNAAKHSSMNADIEITVETIDGSLMIMVKDEGDGIPEEMQARIFDLYARTRYFRSSHPESTGLGLCIAKSIVDRHKGSIDFESAAGKGTTIYIRLPIPQQNIAVLNL